MVIDTVSGFRRMAESPAIGFESLEIGFQSLALKSESPAIGLQSPALRLQSLAIETRIWKNGAKQPVFNTF